jgi:hypothetical protein
VEGELEELLAKAERGEAIEDGESLLTDDARDAFRPGLVGCGLALAGVEVAEPLAEKPGDFALRLRLATPTPRAISKSGPKFMAQHCASAW